RVWLPVQRNPLNRTGGRLAVERKAAGRASVPACRQGTREASATAVVFWVRSICKLSTAASAACLFRVGRLRSPPVTERTSRLPCPSRPARVQSIQLQQVS